MTALVRALLIACVGLSLEVVFTALVSRRESGNWRLMGHTYVWMIPIYALVYPFLALLRPWVGPWPFWLRGPFYVALIYAVEYASGWLLRKLTGECPWEHGYRGNRWAVHGLIRLDYAPAWLGACWLFERLYLFLRPGA